MIGLIRLAISSIGDAMVRKGQPGIQSLVDQVVIGAAMEGIRAGLHRVVEISAGSLSVFRREVAGLNREFLDGVHTALAVLLSDPRDVARRLPGSDADFMRLPRP